MEASVVRLPGQPGGSRHDGRRSDRRSCRSARSAGWRSRSRGSTRGVRREACVPRASGRSMEPSGGARGYDEGRQRSATRKVKAAPADEARAVRHSKRREALAPDRARTGAPRSMRKRRRSRASLERVDRSWPVRIARPSHPNARTARTDAGRERTLIPYETMLDSHPVRTRRCEVATGPRVRCQTHRRRATTRPTRTK